jgi:LmbE family N-acetylglucosaminyl deacetylase
MPNSYSLPTEVSRIEAERVLVLAPHADDDILGCGGLLAQLADAGTTIRVLFLTDSSGGDEVVEDRASYADRRRAEATSALAVLGISDIAQLETPDGELRHSIDSTASAIEAAILELRPDLLLSVSPLETTGDHQAAFAALHAVLSPLRGGTELDEAVADLRVLLYDINRPALPDVLVDVSAELPRLDRAIREHASQLALHNYLDGAIGIRRYRTLSLPTTVEAAEGYRRLRVEDFVTHSPSALIRRLGGVPELHEISEGPLVSVVVRTRDRPELLRQALASLAAGSYRRVEVVLMNDGGEPPEVPDDYPFRVVAINLAENQGRAAAANAGVEAATGDYIAFLDDDDLAEAEHLATLVSLVSAEGVRVAYTDAAVGVYELDPDQGWRQRERRLPYSRDFDPELLLFDNYIPFNTLLIERSLFAEVGPFDSELPFFEDWELLIRLSEAAPFHHHPAVTCEYRHFRGGDHHVFGERPSQRGDFLEVKAKVIERHRHRHSAAAVARVIDRLRAETVARDEALTTCRRESEAMRSTLSELEDSYHRLNGERESLRIERDALRSDREALSADRDRLLADRERHRAHAGQLEENLDGLREQEKRLREVVEEQDAHLKRVYAEIERLNGVIQAMEGTRAWRWHRRIEKLRGR